MAEIDYTYHKLVEEILNDGFTYEDPNRKGEKRVQIPKYTFVHNFSDGFPAPTTKELYWRGVVGETLWILRGDTNIKYLVDNDINIWNKDAYNYYLNWYNKSVVKNITYPLTRKEFIEHIKTNKLLTNGKYILGDLGKVYGYQLRNFAGIFDQLKWIINTMKNNPLATKKTVTYINPADKYQQALTPCFTEDTLINTSKGYKKIIDIKENDLVLVKEGDYKRVYKKMKTPYEGTLIGLDIKGRRDILKCTPNHEFFVKDKGWVDALFLEEGDYVGMPINQSKKLENFYYKQKVNQVKEINKSIDMSIKDVWWMMGYFLGDGWVSKSANTIHFAVADSEKDIIIPKLKKVLPSLNEMKKRNKNSGASNRYYLTNKGYSELLRLFGSGASNKFIPEFVHNAPKDYIKIFLEGYKMADGTKTVDFYQYGTVSESLAYGVQLLLAKIGQPSTVTYSNQPKYKEIQGRKVRQKEKYYIVNSYLGKTYDVILDDDILWYEIQNIYNYKNIKTTVYNMSVEESHTYTAFNIINHNCHTGFKILVEPLTYEEKLYRPEEYGFTLQWEQDSVDTFLGLPFNIASYALLAKMLGTITNMVPKGIIGDLSNVHIYKEHLPAVEKQLRRDVNKYGKCELSINHLAEDYMRSDNFDLDNFLLNAYINDYTLKGYESYSPIKAKMLAYNK